jgi:hypothetical protein
MRVIEKISLIINESYRWRNRELIINPSKGEKEPEKLNFFRLFKRNIISILICSSLTYFFQNIINSNLAGYLISALSIFVGLFTTVLILFFDKYLTHKTNVDASGKDNEIILTERLKVKNFSTRFIFITLETILIAIVLIALLSSPLIFDDFFKEDFNSYTFKIGFPQSIIMIGLILVIAIKVFILLLFYKLAARLLFIFGSLGEYMFSVLNNKIKNI